MVSAQRTLAAALVPLSLLTASLSAESIRNWPAPRSWTPPAAAAAEKKFQVAETMGVHATLPTGPLPFFGITPCRLVDTRPLEGFPGAYGAPAMVANATRDFDLNSAPHCPGVSASAQAYSLNVTVTQTTALGDIRIWPTGNPPASPVSTQNWPGAGSTIANAAVVPAGTGGSITVQVAGSGAHLIIDINGYYAPAATAASKTVAVDCTLGQSLQGAIDSQDGPLVVEVHGICHENISVHRRKDLTLRGVNPNTDGIQGVANAGGFPGLRISYVDLSAIENLSISNGPSNGVVVFFSRITMTNCRINGNAGFGIMLGHSSNVTATGLTVSNNQAQGARSGSGSFFACAECDFQSNVGFAGAAVNGGFLSLQDTTVTGVRGILSSANSYADLDCASIESSHPCSLNVTGRAAHASVQATAALYFAGNFTGQLEAGDGGSVHLIGARQLANGQPGQGPTSNIVNSFGTLSAVPDDDGQQSQLFGPTNVSGFGRLLLRGMTTLVGAVQCDSAGDAWFDATIVKGPGAAETGCEHGVLPP